MASREDRADAEHERRVDHARMIDAISGRPRHEPHGADFVAVDAFLAMFSNTVDRPVHRDTERSRDVVTQRCRACRVEIRSRVTAGMRALPDWAARLGHLIRPTVASTLHGFTNAELDELFASTERESLRLMERADMIRHTRLDREKPP